MPSPATNNVPPRAAEDDPSLHAWLLGVSVAVIGLSFLLRVEGDRQVVVPVVNVALPELCYSQRLFGLACPGCGLTRSFISLAHGEWSRAWHFNAVGLLFFVLVAGQIPYRIWQLLRLRRGLAGTRWGIWGITPLVFLAGLLVLQWLLRTWIIGV